MAERVYRWDGVTKGITNMIALWQQKRHSLPKECDACAHGIHKDHTEIGCVATVARSPFDYVCQCAVPHGQRNLCL
jgi:hypothetical protein